MRSAPSRVASPANDAAMRSSDSANVTRRSRPQRSGRRRRECRLLRRSPRAARAAAGAQVAGSRDRPTACTADREEAGMLPGAVVMDGAGRPTLLLSALEILLGSRSLASRLRTAASCAGSADGTRTRSRSPCRRDRAVRGRAAMPEWAWRSTGRDRRAADRLRQRPLRRLGRRPRGHDGAPRRCLHGGRIRSLRR